MKAQDILVLIKIFLKEPGSWSMARLAHELYMSSSEIHAGIKRLKASRLVVESMDFKGVIANPGNMEEFFIHGLKYVFPAEVGKEVRGMPTSHSAKPLSEEIASENDIMVWPYEFGNARGKSISPLYRSAPKAAELDEDFYKILVLLDGIRIGKNREHNLSVEILRKKLKEKNP